MKKTYFLSLGLALVAAGCTTTDRPAGEKIVESAPPRQQDTAQQARDYRNQAYALQDMADRRQAEADLLARDLGQGDPAVENKRRLVEELRAAADEADAKARALRENVPHGMIQ